MLATLTVLDESESSDLFYPEHSPLKTTVTCSLLSLFKRYDAHATSQDSRCFLVKRSLSMLRKLTHNITSACFSAMEDTGGFEVLEEAVLGSTCYDDPDTIRDFCAVFTMSSITTEELSASCLPQS